jgi:diguanylate cyclase (GGDEF)-like protein
MRTICKIGIGIILALLDYLLIFVYCKGQIDLLTPLFAGAVILIDLLIILSLLLLEKNQKLKKAVETDWLTGGYNRYGFLQKAHTLLKTTKSGVDNYIVVNMNIVDFKKINQQFGERDADQILKEIYTLFDGYVKDNELFCRSGVDYFLFLLHKETNDILNNSLNQMLQSIEKMDRAVQVDFKIGACRIQDSDSLEITINQATYIMNQNDTVNQCVFYDDNFAKQEKEKSDLLDAFESGIKHREFKVYLQPIVSTSDKYPLAAEALVRWNHPQKGLLSPDKFIPVLEECNKIAELDLYMFEAACQIIEKQLSEGKDHVEISVNLSRIHLKQKGLCICEDYYRIKSQYHIPEGAIKLEITENSMFELDDIGMIYNIVDGFRAMGLRIGLDDFGYAYSSIVLLKDLKVDVLKLDRSFFLNENLKSYKIVGKIIELAHELGMLVVAEGIEEKYQVDKLRSLNCDYIQGYYFSKPVPCEDFEQWRKIHD